ncbi:MAG: hypothetical protein HUJ96_04415 [Marinilabiliaceae bacterium]|nr:hypothetical protein [Marinilabiliaceae bacterium]
MIPKIIHYSWFSGEPYPLFLKECMDTWRDVLPDYEFVLWDAEKLKATGNTFALEAYGEKKWAFAADFIRLYAVYHYGGIWLDTDIDMFKSFDPFLNDGMFIGREYYVHKEHGKEDFTTLTSHCFGAEKGHPFIAECMEFYENRHFIRSHNQNLPQELRYDMTIIPMLQMRLAENYGFDNRNSINKLQVLTNGIHVYPSDYFDQPGYGTMKNVVCIHRVAQSWNPKWNKDKEAESVPHSKHETTISTNPKKKGLGYYKIKLINNLHNILNRI